MFLIHNRFAVDSVYMTQIPENAISNLRNNPPACAAPKRPVPGIALRLCILCFTLFFFCPRPSSAESDRSGAQSAQNQSGLELTPEERAVLAKRYAPELIYHADEKYFPCSPLFPLEVKAADSGLQSTGRDSAVSRLGTAESRRKTYLGFTMEEKADLATVYYRVYPARRRSEDIIVIEYWLYYVRNVYRARASILPLWFDTSHPNDMEHLHVILKVPPQDDREGKLSNADLQFALEEVYASAHEGIIPANRYLHFDQPESDSIRFLVELGSHAAAADIDRDGQFTPGRDGDSGYKMLWGIRDKGVPWIWYRRSYMTPRSEQTSIAFSPVKSESKTGNEPEGVFENRHFAYRLVPVESLEKDFADIELTDGQRKEAFETPVNWIMRSIGRSNGNSGKLLLPRKPEANSDSLNIKNFASAERGFMAGVTNLIAEPGVFVGGRYAFLNGKKYLPDLMLEADGILTTKGKGYLSTQFLLTYPIDATTKLMGGYGFVTDSLRFDRRQWDWIGAIEARLGFIRIYGATRTWGHVTRSAVDFRVSYFF